MAVIIDCWTDTERVPNIIARLQSQPLIELVVLATYTNADTEQWSMDRRLAFYRTLPGQRVFHCTTTHSLVKLLSQHTVDQVIVMGSAWEVCIQDRPLGVRSLNQLRYDHGYTWDIVAEPECLQSQDLVPVEPLLAKHYSWRRVGSQYHMYRIE